MTASAAGVSASATFTLTNVGAGATITAGGIGGVGGSVPPVQTLSQNALISIYGQGFLPPGATGRGVLPSEYVNGGLPAMLLGVCVDVSGQPAAMLDVFPTQINAQVPAVTGASASVRVLTNCGTPAEAVSAPQTVAVSAASPEFLYFQLNADGQDPVVLVNATTGALVGPSNILDGALTPARAGDVLTAYGTGLGALTPGVGDGADPVGYGIGRGADIGKHRRGCAGGIGHFVRGSGTGGGHRPVEFPGTSRHVGGQPADRHFHSWGQFAAQCVRRGSVSGR